jgi:hypothetical protein
MLPAILLVFYVKTVPEAFVEKTKSLGIAQAYVSVVRLSVLPQAPNPDPARNECFPF